MKARDLDIPEPCHEDWGSMTPTEQGRHCAACKKTVHDLSSMTEREADRLLASGADVCVSFRSRADGSIRFAPESLVPPTRLRRRLPIAAAGLSMALAACAPHAGDPTLEVQEGPVVTTQRFATIPDTLPERQKPASSTDEPDESAVTPPPVEPAPSVEPPQRPRLLGVPRPRKMGKPVFRPEPEHLGL